MSQVKLIENLRYNVQTKDAGLLDIYLPKLSEGEKVPLLIYFHGGGLESGDKKDNRGLYTSLASKGMVVVSANYRMYPEIGYPVFIEDAAKAVSYSLAHIKEYANCKSVWIGGISAGAYLSMMLHFVPNFLKKCGVEEIQIAGYIFDGGQPTVHFNVLRERKMDTGAVRVDEAAPIYYLVHPYEANKNQHFLFIWADNDIPGRTEQNELLMRTMETHGYDKEQMEYRVMQGFGHAGYVDVQNEDGQYPYADMLWDYINKFK